MTQNNQKISIGDIPLTLPHDHKLPIYLNRYPEYDFLYWNILGSLLIENDLDNITLIDIGANVGDSAAHYRRHSLGPILAIEPSPKYFNFLKTNAEEFDDITLINSVVTTKDVGAGITVTCHDGTGSTQIDENSNFEGEIILANELIQRAPAEYILKSDTDGFDGHLILALAEEMLVQKNFAKMITFEGPSKIQGLNNEVQSHKDAIKFLMSQGYVVQLLSNLGKPIAFVGSNFDAFEWHIKVWLNSLAKSDFTCPYYDFICVKSDLKMNTLKFEIKSYANMLANSFTLKSEGV